MHCREDAGVRRAFSPTSRTCFIARRSSYICCFGFSRNRLATTDPIFPNGGRYSISTRMSVPRSPVARSNQTVPEFSTVEPGRDRHEIRRFGSSAVISASHSTELPPGARVFQCVRPLPVSVTDSRWFINRGRFSKLRQKPYTSSGERPTMIDCAIRMRPSCVVPVAGVLVLNLSATIVVDSRDPEQRRHRHNPARDVAVSREHADGDGPDIENVASLSRESECEVPSGNSAMSSPRTMASRHRRNVSSFFAGSIPSRGGTPGWRRSSASQSATPDAKTACSCRGNAPAARAPGATPRDRAARSGGSPPGGTDSERVAGPRR